MPKITSAPLGDTSQNLSKVQYIRHLMKKLPIGIQSIAEILEEGQLYVDKTAFAKQLIDEGKHYFLSRPRRFGKSLFLSTLEHIFKGDKELFKGCQIYESDYNWQNYPVLHFDFSRIATASREEFKDALHDTLVNIGQEYNKEITGSSIQSQLERLIAQLAKKAKVVVLVDEYDKPMISNLKNTAVAEQNRDFLCDFFGTLKGLDKYLKFTFFTGVSKFSQVSIFSGLNNLKDITMHERYATMMGYTEEELLKNFDDHLDHLSAQTKESKEKILDTMRSWYNGYRFSQKETTVYNPFSTLNFFDAQKTEEYWYSTGTPSFLIDQVKNRPQSIIPLSGTTLSKARLSNISEVTQIDLATLMFQTGYLTIIAYNSVTNNYTLGFPNKEVKKAFFETLIQHFAKINASLSSECQSALDTHNIDLFFHKIQAAIASFPHQLFIKASESTYHGILLGILKGMGLQAHGERATNRGRIDIVIETDNTFYVLELKLDIGAEKALSQVQNKKYYEQFLYQAKQILLVGIGLSSASKNISEWKGLLFSEGGKLIQTLLPPSNEQRP